MDAEKRGGGGFVERCPKKSEEPKKERRRRLILDDSDSDEPSVPVCEKAEDDGQCRNEDWSIGGVGIAVKRIEEEGRAEERWRKEEEDVRVGKNGTFDVGEKSKLVALSKRILGSDVVNSNEAHSKDKEVDQTPLDTEVHLESIKTNLYKQKEENGDRICSKELKMDYFRNRGPAEEINAETPGGSKVLTGNGKERHKMSSKETYSDSTEIAEWTEWSGNIVPKKLKDQRSSVIAEKGSTDTGIGKVRGNVLRVQGKGGVLKFSPSKKLGGIEIFRAKNTEEERTIPELSRIAKGGASKQPSLSEDRNSHQKLVPGGSSGENLSKGIVSLPAKDELKLKAKCKVLSPRDNSKRLDRADRESDMEDDISYSSKASVLKKQRMDEGNEAASTAKQKLRDQIKNILLNAGWKIDLRPRRGREYSDSVYIPPEGKGSYWSITKAYAVYQDKLNAGPTDKSSLSGMPSSSLTGNNSNVDVGSLPSVIPTESLNILRRVVVNKRRRAEELEDADRDQTKKTKRSIKKPQAKKFTIDETRQTKKSNERLVSKIHYTAASKVHKHLQTDRDKHKGRSLLARSANKEAKFRNGDYIFYDGKRTVLTWMIDLGVIPENGKVSYMNSKRTKSKLEGWITRDGIYCSCCSKTLTLAKFELHAGSKLQQASENIYIEDEGISLVQCQLTAWEKQSESERRGFYTVDTSDDDPNDDTCGICGDGGDLICCDGCPSTFHLSCLGIQMLPPGDWNCSNCSCKFCGAVSRAAVEETDGTFPPLLSCSQCEEKYHQNCVSETDYVSACSNSSSSFCGQGCRKISMQLQKLLGIKNNLEAGFSWTVIRRFDDDCLSFKLPQRAEFNSKIAVAFAVMDECFEPIIDQRSGINLIHNVVYNCGSNFSRLDYRGFYTFILERGDEMISAASVRIHGTKLAEMPFIGTRNIYRRQGMCRRLLDGIETALCSLNVEKLVIPAISELKDTWTSIFGFKTFEVSEELEVKSINMLVFPGTGLLLKPLVEKSPSEPHAAADIVAKVEGNITQHGALAMHETSECEAIYQTSSKVVLHLSQHMKANDNHEMTSINDSSIMKLHNADNEFIKCSAKIKCIPEDVFASDLQESGDKSGMLSTESKLVKHDVLDISAIQKQSSIDSMRYPLHHYVRNLSQQPSFPCSTGSRCQVSGEHVGDANCGVKDIVSDIETKVVVDQVPKENSSPRDTYFLGRTSGTPACSSVTKKCHIAGQKYLQTSVLPALSEPAVYSNGRDTSQ